MPTTQFGGGERVGMAPGGGNLISLNTLRSRTARTIPPRQYQNTAPLAVAIETSPKEVSFGCKMRIYCFKDIGTQIFRRKLFMRCRQNVRRETEWFHDIISLRYLQHFFYTLFFLQHIFLWDVRKYVSVTVRHIPWSPTPLIYWPACPRGRPE